jgi:hypothetical protein
MMETIFTVLCFLTTIQETYSCTMAPLLNWYQKTVFTTEHSVLYKLLMQLPVFV